MPRLLLATLLILALSIPARSDERGYEVARALKLRVTKVVRDARPSIASILVSGSDAYLKAPYWGAASRGDQQGQLGRFDAEATAKLVPTDAPNRARILRTIAQHDLSDPNNIPESYGSGFVVDRSGLILTNAHVVKGATKIYVRLPDHRGSWADIHASDPRSDLAVLKLLDPPADLKPLPRGEDGYLERGEFVVSIANPYAPGFRGDAEPTFGHGLVSNLRRKIPGGENEAERHKLTLHHYGTLIQTDAQTTPGCSGGALLDLDGKVIGLNTALAGVRSDRPGGFAVPLDANTWRIVDVLKRGEEVEYGFLGVELQTRGPGGGVHILRVTPGSPAEHGGIRQNDRILSVNRTKIEENDHLFLYVGMALADSTANVEVAHHFGGRKTCEVRLAKFYVPGEVIASKRPPARFGLRVDHTSILAQRNPFPSRRPMPIGVVVREIIPNSPADEARFDLSKVITHVNGIQVKTPAEYYRAMEKVTGKEVELTYLTSDDHPAKLTLKEK